MTPYRLPELVARSRGRAIAVVAVLGLAQAACLFGTAYATRGLFSVLHGDTLPPQPLLALLCLSAIGAALCQAIARTKAERIGQSYAIDLRDRVFKAIAALPPKIRQKRSLGGLSLRFVGDMGAAKGWVGLGVVRLISGALVFPAALICLWWLAPPLAIAGFGPLVVALFLMAGLGFALRQRHVKLRKGRAGLAIFAIERILAIERLSQIGRLTRDIKDLRRGGEAVADSAVRRIARVSLLRGLPEAALGLGGAAILWVTLESDIPASTAAAALAVLAIVALPLKQMTGVWDRYAAWSVARARCLALLQQACVKTEQQKPLATAAGSPCFTETAPLKIPSGKIVGLTCEDVDERFALLKSIAHTDTGNRDLSIALVSDNPAILRGSLRRVLALGLRKRLDDEIIAKIADSFGLAPLINRLGGLGGRVQEGGANLTATEKLRVSVTQAVLASPDVVVVQSLVWPHLADAREVFARLIEAQPTVVHGLPVAIAPQTSFWVDATLARTENGPKAYFSDMSTRKCA